MFSNLPSDPSNLGLCLQKLVEIFPHIDSIELNIFDKNIQSVCLSSGASDVRIKTTPNRKQTLWNFVYLLERMFIINSVQFYFCISTYSTVISRHFHRVEKQTKPKQFCQKERKGERTDRHEQTDICVFILKYANPSYAALTCVLEKTK